MKQLVFKSIIAGALAIFFASCASNETANSDTVSQSEIYQTYSVEYDDADMELSATASYRFGGNKGTTLALISPSQVTFNGEKMAQDNNVFSGTFYNISRQVKFPGTFNFVFTDSDKKNYKNTINISPIEPSDYNSTIDTTEAYVVGWKGKPLQNAETITVYIESENHATCSKSSSIVGATSVRFEPIDLKNLNSGPANIYIERKANYSLQESTHLGGRMSATYSSKKVGVNVK